MANFVKRDLSVFFLYIDSLQRFLPIYRLLEFSVTLKNFTGVVQLETRRYSVSNFSYIGLLFLI